MNSSEHENEYNKAGNKAEIKAEIKAVNNAADKKSNKNVSLKDKAKGEKKCCCAYDELSISGRKKHRDAKEKNDLMNRLKRIEGQVRGVENMLDDNVYCPDIMIQVSAINAALNSFNKVLMADHIRTCVADDIRAGKDETVDELVNTLQKVMK